MKDNFAECRIVDLFNNGTDFRKITEPVDVFF